MVDEERTWIILTRKGDQEAFARLVDEYQTSVFNLCYRMLGNAAEAEDAAQETFIRAYTRIGSYDTKRKFSSWLLSIASHYCIDQLRRRRFSLISWDEMPAWSWPADPSPQPEEVTLDRENEAYVHALLDELPGDYRAAVVLRYWHSMPYDEIAQTLGTTLSAIKSRLFRARQMMASAASSRTDVASLAPPQMVGSQEI